jgi:hypothetical protein
VEPLALYQELVAIAKTLGAGEWLELPPPRCQPATRLERRPPWRAEESYLTCKVWGRVWNGTLQAKAPGAAGEGGTGLVLGPTGSGMGLLRSPCALLWYKWYLRCIARVTRQQARAIGRAGVHCWL